MKQLIAKLIPFVLLGLALTAISFGLILFVYLMMIGAALGAVALAIQWVRAKFLPSKPVRKTPEKKKDEGRIITTEWHRL